MKHKISTPRTDGAEFDALENHPQDGWKKTVKRIAYVSRQLEMAGEELRQQLREAKNPDAHSELSATDGSASPWTSQIRGLEERVDLVRDSAYRNKYYDISSALQDVMRALYRIRVNHNQTPNEKGQQ